MCDTLEPVKFWSRNICTCILYNRILREFELSKSCYIHFSINNMEGNVSAALPTDNMKQPRERDLYLMLFLWLSETENNLRAREITCF